MEGQRIKPLNTEPLLGHLKHMKVLNAMHAAHQIPSKAVHMCREYTALLSGGLCTPGCPAHHACAFLQENGMWTSTLTCMLTQNMTNANLQVADLNRGAFGFVQLAKDVTTGEQVAIKFIERGDKVKSGFSFLSANRREMAITLLPTASRVLECPATLQASGQQASGNSNDSHR